MIANAIEIRDSTIHGRGVFARRALREGEVIIDWTTSSKRLSDDDVALLSEDERRYVSRIDGQYVLFEAPARFVNHSCSPNAFGKNGADVAVRDIAQGEEITVDYVAESVPGLNLQCRCGSFDCRGLLKED